MQEYNPRPAGSDDPAVPQPAAAQANSPFVGGPAPAPRHVTTPLADHPPFAAAPTPAPVPVRAPKRQGVRGTVLAALLGLSVAAGGIGGGATALTLSQALATPTATASAPAATSQQIADESANLISTLYTKVAA